MSTRPKPSAVIFAKDVARVARFYSEAAGVDYVRDDSDPVVLDSGQFQPVVHGIPR